MLPWVVDGAGGLGAGKTSGAGTRGVDLNAARRIYGEWTAKSDPAYQKYIGLILRLSCEAAIPPKQRK